MPCLEYGDEAPGGVFVSIDLAVMTTIILAIVEDEIVDPGTEMPIIILRPIIVQKDKAHYPQKVHL